MKKLIIFCFTVFIGHAFASLQNVDITAHENNLEAFFENKIQDFIGVSEDTALQNLSPENAEKAKNYIEVLINDINSLDINPLLKDNSLEILEQYLADMNKISLMQNIDDFIFFIIKTILVHASNNLLLDSSDTIDKIKNSIQAFLNANEDKNSSESKSTDIESNTSDVIKSIKEESAKELIDLIEYIEVLVKNSLNEEMIQQYTDNILNILIPYIKEYLGLNDTPEERTEFENAQQLNSQSLQAIKSSQAFQQLKKISDFGKQKVIALFKASTTLYQYLQDFFIKTFFSFFKYLKLF